MNLFGNYFSTRMARLGKDRFTDEELVAAARETEDWRSLYDVFCCLLAEKKQSYQELVNINQRLVDENKLLREEMP